ncbi:neuronal acetylcholine receptor subunit alpha-7-like [Anneissia japonica]|uniref:neuronal acetylcholine receptor subunit alpha-7-like n=1 Tax=Anneissia japonica TaxID=1529436 RepID=UPI0014258756|nr:neuronal acetylcholine receptor subunit alpha-7-like [Anneissia japonica]XP_033112660.1 neuronal acetylcholine receptor subunit alpha-7-like [Anneissia japonica]
MLKLDLAFLLLTAQFLSVNSISNIFITKNNETLITEALLDSIGPPTNRPVLDEATIVNVSLSFVLTQIIELNDMLQELKVAGWFTMTWKDERIGWNPYEHNVKCVKIPVDSIWKPDLTLDNNIDEEYNQFLPNTPVEVCSDGNAKYAAYSIFRSSCHINIELYPYDNQTCRLRFSSWVHNMLELDVHPKLRSLDQAEQFDDNGIWELIGVDGNREVEKYKTGANSFVYAVFTFYLMRRHEFQLLFVLIPYFFCSFLICLMFFIPMESGEKLSYGITAVLGMIVFQEIIAFSLPPVGNESTIVGKYFTTVICLGIISVFIEILVNNVYMQGNVYKASMYLLKWCRSKSAFNSKAENDNHCTAQTEESQNSMATTADEKHTLNLQHYCAIFDFYFGILYFALLLILMFWFFIVI